MSSDRRYDREQVLPHYWRLWEAMIPACDKCGYVGSVRRREESVSELDMLVLPFFDKRDSLFADGNEALTYSQFDAVLEQLLRDGVLIWDETNKKRGPWWKRFIIPAAGIPFDLFVARPGNYGIKQVIHTGCKQLSHAWVRSRRSGGLLPESLVCDQGYVWRKAHDRDGNEVRDLMLTHTEEDVFDLWELLPFERALYASNRTPKLVSHLRHRLGLPPMPMYVPRTSEQGAYA